MEIKEITSKQNDKLKLARSLTGRAGRKKSGKFLLEGKTLIKEALKVGLEIDSIFITEEDTIDKFLSSNSKSPDASHHDLDALTEKLKSISLYQIEKSFIKEISSTESPPDIVAIASQPAKLLSKANSSLFEDKKFILYCEEISDPGNLGSIIRSAFGAGCDLILLSPNCADVFNPKVLRSSIASVFRGDIKANFDIADLENPDQYQIIASSSFATTNYTDLKAKERVILMVGSESHGLSEKSMQLATDTVKIPMANNIESLNVVAATSVLLYSLQWKSI